MAETVLMKRARKEEEGEGEGEGSGSSNKKPKLSEGEPRDPGKKIYREMKRILKQLYALMELRDKDNQLMERIRALLLSLTALVMTNSTPGETPNPVKLMQIHLKCILFASDSVNDFDNIKDFLNSLEDCSAVKSSWKDTAYVFLANLATELWYQWSDELGQWQWTPESDDKLWMPCSTNVVSDGQWKGEVPAPENVDIINYLNAVRPVPSDEQYLPSSYNVVKLLQNLFSLGDKIINREVKNIVETIAYHNHEVPASNVVKEFLEELQSITFEPEKDKLDDEDDEETVTEETEDDETEDGYTEEGDTEEGDTEEGDTEEGDTEGDLEEEMDEETEGEIGQIKPQMLGIEEESEGDAAREMEDVGEMEAQQTGDREVEGETSEQHVEERAEGAAREMEAQQTGDREVGGETNGGHVEERAAEGETTEREGREETNEATAEGVETNEVGAAGAEATEGEGGEETRETNEAKAGGVETNEVGEATRETNEGEAGKEEENEAKAAGGTNHDTRSNSEGLVHQKTGAEGTTDSSDAGNNSNAQDTAAEAISTEEGSK